MNTSGDRLKALLKECHLSAADFAAHRRVMPQHINNWFNRGIPAALVHEIAELLSVHPQWLRTGEGPKYASHNLNQTDTRTYLQRPGSHPHASDSDDLLIPFHHLHAGALHPSPCRHLRLPRSVLTQLAVSQGDAVALVMPDASLADRLPPSSPLAIDRSLVAVTDGQLYALIHNARLTVRYLTACSNEQLCLRSVNAAQCSEQTVPASQVTVLGWVFWHATLTPLRPTPATDDDDIRGGHTG